MMRSLAICWGELLASHEVLRQLIRQQLILRYRRTALGFLWTLINPLLMMTVTAVVFAAIFKISLEAYAIFIFAGMIPWYCFNSIVTQSGSALIGNEGLIKKIYLPKMLFPMSVSLALLIDSALAFVALFSIMLAFGGQQLSWGLLFIPVAYLLLFFFAFGIALVISVATVFFRDLQHIITIAMQAWFFLTPVMYKSDALTGKVAYLVAMNPLTVFIDLFRAPLYHATLPTTAEVAASVGLAIVSIVIGPKFFLSQEKKIVFRL